MLFIRIWVSLVALALLSACGGGDVAVTTTEATGETAQSALVLNGIWEGDYTASSGTICNDLRGLIYNGNVYAISEDCDVVLTGTLSISGDDIASVNFDLYAVDGTSNGQSSFSGSFTVQSRIDGSLDNGAGISFAYQTVYENDSSLASLAATWGLEETIALGTVLNIFAIDDAGSMGSLVIISGCDYSASFTILDADYNLYGVSLTVSNCPVDQVSRNGIYAGVASLSGNNRIMTVLAGNAENVFFADFIRISGSAS